MLVGMVVPCADSSCSCSPRSRAVVPLRSSSSRRSTSPRSPARRLARDGSSRRPNKTSARSSRSTTTRRSTRASTGGASSRSAARCSTRPRSPRSRSSASSATPSADSCSSRPTATPTCRPNPLGPLERVAPPRSEPLASVTAGRAAILGIAGGTLVRSSDWGATWRPVDYAGGKKLFGAASSVALDGKGNGVLVHLPQRLYVTHDDGATWAPIAAPRYGAVRALRDGADRIFVTGYHDMRATLAGDALAETNDAPAPMFHGQPAWRPRNFVRPSRSRFLPPPPLDDLAGGDRPLRLLAGDRVVEIRSTPARRRSARPRSASHSARRAARPSSIAPPSTGTASPRGATTSRIYAQRATTTPTIRARPSSAATITARPGRKSKRSSERRSNRSSPSRSARAGGPTSARSARAMTRAAASRRRFDPRARRRSSTRTSTSIRARSSSTRRTARSTRSRTRPAARSCTRARSRAAS